MSTFGLIYGQDVGDAPNRTLWATGERALATAAGQAGLGTPSPMHHDSSVGPPSMVHRAQRGDEEAFRALYRSVQPRLLRYLRVLVGPDAEDVASEAWLQIVQGLRSFRGDDSGFRGWAATVARNRAMDHLRRQRRRPAWEVPDDQLNELPGGDDTAALALDAVSTDAALAWIASLPQDQAEAVLLRVVMGLDAESGGRVLGKRAGAVRTAAYRGLRRLAASLDEGRGASSGGRHEGGGHDSGGHDSDSGDGHDAEQSSGIRIDLPLPGVR